MDNRAQIVAEARRWLGTPFHHQAALLGAGVDCVGLIRGVGVACDMVTVSDEDWRRFSHYGRVPSPRRMMEGMRLFLNEIQPGEELPGDIAWIQWREGIPMHLALLAEHNGRRTLIHSLSDFGKVLEHGFTSEWKARVSSWWRYPGLST